MTGYLCLSQDGDVQAFGAAPFHGSAAGVLDGPASAIAVDRTGDGYWVASRSGRVAAFGVPDLVGPEGVPSTRDIVDLVASTADRGLWVLDAAGGVFCYGAADFYGSVPGLALDTPVDAVALAATPDERGYWVLDRVGGVFCFGNAPYFGSIPELGIPAAPAVALLPAPGGNGYTIFVEDGAARTFGRATEPDSVVARSPIVAAVNTAEGTLLVDAQGIVYPLGHAPFLGTPAAIALHAPIVDAAWYADRLSG